MSRIGKKAILLPEAVEISLRNKIVDVKGPKGQISKRLSDLIEVNKEGNSIYLKRKILSKKSNQLYGLSRTLISNMVQGVHKGFTKSLEIQGVGYRSQMQGTNLILSLGYSHTITVTPPQGISITVESNTNIHVYGVDKELVGQVAAEIRSKRPPEPYKGKGVRYKGEFVQRKVGKAGKGK